METDVLRYIREKTRLMITKKAIAACLTAGFICILALSFYFLYNSPDVGASFSWDETAGHYKAASVRTWSPLRQGDVLLAIGDLNVGFPHLLNDNIYIKSRGELFSWFEAKRQVFNALNRAQADLRLIRDGVETTIPVRPQKTGFSFLARLIFLHVIVGIVFFLTGMIVYHKKEPGEESYVFLAMSLAMTLIFISNAASLMSTTAFEPLYHKIINMVNIVCLPLGNVFLFHLSLFLPKKRKTIERFPCLILIFYAVCIAIISSFHIRTINSLTGALTTMSIISMLYGFVMGKSPLERQQMKWVFLGFFLGLGPWVFLNGIPLLIIGRRLVDDTITGACVAFIPISMAFAIRKYRLMDIDSFMEGTFAYTLTILLLCVLDLGLLSLLGRRLEDVNITDNIFLHPILLIALYVVFRERIGRLVGRVFKRAPLNESETIALFNRRAAGKGADRIMQTLYGVLMEAFRLKDIMLVKAGDSVEREMFAGFNGREGVINLWEAPGFSGLTAKGFYIALAFHGDKGTEGRTLFLMGAVAGKDFYSRKDILVLNSLYVQARTLLENAVLHERMLAESDARLREEKRHEREKEIILKDLHDGIGGLVSSIHLLSETAARDPSHDAARSALSTVSGLAREGLSEISGFLMSLDPEDADFDTLVAEYQALGNRIISPHGMGFTLESSVKDRGRQTGRLLFYNALKIYREALTNIVRHALARSVLVKVTVDRERFVLTIQDDGTGFTGGKTGGRGIANMKARARDMGGSLTIISEKGLLVRLEAPLAPESGRDAGYQARCAI